MRVIRVLDGAAMAVLLVLVMAKVSVATANLLYAGIIPIGALVISAFTLLIVSRYWAWHARRLRSMYSYDEMRELVSAYHEKRQRETQQINAKREDRCITDIRLTIHLNAH